jgi:hypothetical protein
MPEGSQGQYQLPSGLPVRVEVLSMSEPERYSVPSFCISITAPEIVAVDRWSLEGVGEILRAFTENLV